jgi:hypothetical protein
MVGSETLKWCDVGHGVSTGPGSTRHRRRPGHPRPRTGRAHVPDDARTRITECSDLNQLDTWIRRAATAESIDDLFD